MPRYKLTIEYDGTNYHGWQFQQGLPTVQGEIEKAVEKLCGQYCELFASGRTDAGVHALGQVAHVDLPKEYEPFRVQEAINYYLKPQPIAILSAEVTSNKFHARFSTTERSYIYRIINRYAPLTVDQGRALHVTRELDVPAMHEAAQELVGHYDFTTFRDSDCQASSPFKTLDQLEVTQKENDIIEVYARSRSFLHHQVRNMVGTLILVGNGSWSRQDLADALEAKDRRAGGPTASPAGLYLYRIKY